MLHPRGSDDCPARRVGETLAGRYRLEAVLGVGGMGAVFAARHVELDTRVAVKVLHPGFVQLPEAVARFEREAREAAKLRAPGIVPVTDLGSDAAGRRFLVMAMLEGRSLARALEAGPLSANVAVALACDALATLAVAHAAGLVHRDLKPDNLFLVRDDAGEPASTERVKVLDFGIAQVHGDTRFTRADQVLGTPRYMSPEQVQNPAAVDARSDLYAMGAILFEMLTGEPAVGGNSPLEQLANASTGRSVRRHPRDVRPDVPPWLDAVVARAMDADPAARFAGANEMRAALLAAGASASEQATPPAPTSAAQPGPVPPASSNASAPVLTQFEPPKMAADSAAPSGPTAPAVPGAARSRALRRAAVAVAVVCALGAGGWRLAHRASTAQASARTEPAPGTASPRGVTTPVVAALSTPPQPALPARPASTPDGMVRIAGATFGMGSTDDEIARARALCTRADPGHAADACRDEVFARERPRHDVRVADFDLDATEVTNAAFVAWLAARSDLRFVPAGRRGQELARLTDAAGATLAVPHDAREDVTAASGIDVVDGHPVVRPGYDRRPVVLVAWQAAQAFCQAHGGRLPTEAEWELAARGVARRTFPWGDAEPLRAGTVFARESGDPPFERAPTARAERTQDVTPDGVFDLGGNVAEWVGDVFAPYQPCEGFCDAPRGPAPGATARERVLRGGEWRLGGDVCRGAARSRAPEDSALPDVGFRCARPAEQ